MEGRRSKSIESSRMIVRSYGGKRCVFSDLRNDSRDGDERSKIGREFQTVGAAKENDRLPADELTDGTVRKNLSEDRKERPGV